MDKSTIFTQISKPIDRTYTTLNGLNCGLLKIRYETADQASNY